MPEILPSLVTILYINMRHTSAIAKADLTVVSSGICLSGRDRDFDLQSLVGVIEHQEGVTR
jgi:hypothetical protein